MCTVKSMVSREGGIEAIKCKKCSKKIHEICLDGIMIDLQESGIYRVNSKILNDITQKIK